MEPTIDAYGRWVTDPSPDNMATVLDSLAPTLNAEVQRYPGPKPLLQQQAKQLAIKAVRSYDPTSKARLNSWVVTQMQPLRRYGRELGSTVHKSELVHRQQAAMYKAQAELEEDLGAAPTPEQMADHIGISVLRVNELRRQMRPIIGEESQYQGETTQVEQAVDNTGTDPALTTAVEMVYASLKARDQAIYDFKTGAHGRETLDNMTIAKRLGVTPGYISQRSAVISEMILGTMNRV